MSKRNKPVLSMYYKPAGKGEQGFSLGGLFASQFGNLSANLNIRKKGEQPDPIVSLQTASGKTVKLGKGGGYINCYWAEDISGIGVAREGRDVELEIYTNEESEFQDEGENPF